MVHYSTREVAKILGISHSTLANYIKVGKVPVPKSVTSGGTTVHLWTEKEIEEVKQLLPKIANGRKTRYQKQKKRVTKPTSKPNKN